MAQGSKAERLVDLLMLLLHTPRGLTVGEIRERIPGYDQRDDTFHRMFERDKAELRDMGLPLDQEESIARGVTYRIRAKDALLDDPGLTPDEQAALALAAQAWGDEAAAGALKLAAFTGTDGPVGNAWILPRIGLDERSDVIVEAIAQRKRLSFTYRTASGDVGDRTVEPLGLVHRGGWYLIARDVAVGEQRRFKLARIESDPVMVAGSGPDFEPAPVDLEEPRAPWEDDPTQTARVVFSDRTAWSVERRRGVTRAAERPDGSVELDVAYSDEASFVSWIVGFGEDALVVAPPTLRDAVRGRLAQLAERGD